MTIAAGTRLGPYEVLSLLGAGGMGEVYRARDPRLAREVAVKVLPEELFEGEERSARFEREARVLASLNHPGIASIYSFEEIPSSSSSSRHILVMELAEGETLDRKIARGPLPLEESLSLARQIAEALEAAHERGIVHRDLKPANVVVSSEGRVKLLDFGLAKAFEGDAGSSPEISASPTLTARATAAGVILGTAAYMSPEQARGKPVDKRADVWAFGVVLFEMLTGRRLFQGETVSDTLAAVLRDPVDFGKLPPSTPPSVRVLLERCLERDPKQRLQAIGESRIALERTIAGNSSAGVAAPRLDAPGARASRMPLYAGWALAAAFAAATGALALRARDPRGGVVRAKVAPPEGTSFWLESNGPGPAVVSPDGLRIAFTAVDAAGKVNLYVRPLDAGEPRVLSGAEGAQYPFWSPDGRSLGFFTAGKLKTIDAAGGSPLTLCAASEGKGGAWSPAGVILFAPGPSNGLAKVSEKGGDPVPVTKIDTTRGDNSHRHPRFLPDGKHFLYVARSAASAAEGYPVVYASLDGGPEKVLLRSPAAAQFASGHLLFLRETTLMARPMDAATGTFGGDAVPVAERVTMPAPQTAVAVFSASRNGVLVSQSARGELTSRLQWVTRDGKPDGSLGDAADYLGAVLSPDGRLAAVTVLDPAVGTYDIWILDVARGVRTRFTFDRGNDKLPVWSPDGRSLAFASNRKGHYDLYRKALDGSSEDEAIAVSDSDKAPASFTPDGRSLVFDQVGKEPGVEIRTLALDGARTSELWMKIKAEGVASGLSPDGKWLPYSSNESGRWEVYVTSFPRPGRKWQISTEGGAYAFWRADGREIAYHDMAGKIRFVSLEARELGLEVGTSRPVTSASGPSPAAPTFCPSSDFQRILVVGASQKADSLLDLVLNWPAGLGEKR